MWRKPIVVGKIIYLIYVFLMCVCVCAKNM